MKGKYIEIIYQLIQIHNEKSSLSAYQVFGYVSQKPRSYIRTDLKTFLKIKNHRLLNNINSKK